MSRFSLCQRGLFQGDFVITDGVHHYTIGNYIEVVLRERPYGTGVMVKSYKGKEIPLFCFPLTVYSFDSGDVDLVLPIGRTSRHWFDCLEVGKVSLVTSVKCSTRKFTWYMPKINGYLPGMFGKVKVA